ncbi:MAG: metallophosphoesterase [Candidatus Nanoarchaeia archaeon]|jgi:Icc-related predicted phosphoesterase
MKYLILGDMHGTMPKIHLKGFDAIIAIGDFCSTPMRPYMFEAINERKKDPNSKIEWYDITGKEKAKEMINEGLKAGKAILEFLNSLKVPVYIVPGNGDYTAMPDSKWKFYAQDHFSKLVEGLENIINIHLKIKNIDDSQIIGYGISSGPELLQYDEDKKMIKPDRLKKIEKEYESNTKKLTVLFEKAKKPLIFLSHNVPFNTDLDMIVNPESPRNGWHYGSLIAREMIEKYQPVICMGGHMHEHFGKCMLGKTVVVNAGFGPEKNVLLEIEGGKIKQLEFYKAQ